MATPLIMLATMMAPLLIAGSASYAGWRSIDLRSAGAIGLGLLFVFTGIGHFALTEPMARMLPPWVPARVPLIYLSGLLEFAIAIGFFVPRTRRLAGWVAAAVLVLFFPANVYAAIERVPMGGHAWGPVYLLVRAPLQGAILAWVYWFTIRRPA
ncbi:MAG: hypothetical protein GX644_09090 [Limnobacter sp.]|nr:hypothetical protein [Limnobacter sp.]